MILNSLKALLRATRPRLQVFREYGKVLYAFALSIGKTQDLAREMLQQTFLIVWLSRDRLEGIEQPRAHLFKIAANECYQMLRRHLRASALPSETGLIRKEVE